SEFERLTAAVGAALAPEAIVLDFDGVLVDIDRRCALVEASELAALAALRPVALVTSCPRRLCESLLARYGFAMHVTHAVCAEDGPGKPDPWPVLRALRELGVARAWMLGDNPGDVQAARAAGVVSFAIAPRGIGAESHETRLREAGAARLVCGIAELVSLLGGR
ncbi:MAG: HAD-IA family hydrolase, partial [Planctomycetota bacterium]